MSWLFTVPPVARVRSAAARRARNVWGRDRARLSGPAAFRTRVARVAFLAGRGVLTHRLGLHGAALTYYTVFAIVPLLVVVLWSLKLLHHLPVISPELPAQVKVPTGNQLLHSALGLILDAVARTSEVTSGIIGLAALLFAVSKLFGYTERAMHMISATSERAPSFWRVLGYGALLLVPPAQLALSGALLWLLRRAPGEVLPRIIGAIPGFEVALGLVLGFAALWMAVTLLYLSAVRARLPFSSAAAGGALAAVALVVVFWVFASLQVGAKQSSALGSGFLAFPVFLVWAFSSWMTILLGAEVAVAHHVDQVLVHGAIAFDLDGAGARQAGVSMMVKITELAAGGDAVVTEEALARRVRLPPHVVRDLALRLIDRGLLAREAGGLRLRCDPSRTTAARVADAIDRDPALDDRRGPSVPEGASLKELARDPAPPMTT
jgi:membrane protein